ncbi:N-acetylmuramoyl-L-alanine amidase [Thermosyntropha lipolytica DSM 11003]|uniref:N-acetylmuramoyl-L-alanine amidase n=1 Tax=Thermosyntropha lipolytica DSM 11003 TaxID=1123382 RepID=A0A1M5JWN2_9FIRM|nr:N-acetylmuramoyl-L-alanine amidase [Thermosyntropha lipolytica]SHG44956.1 N-acetylmuramoyl-L-alanine amidase [Thermosyntropha lipolytica DSM 11003]
MKLSLIRSRNGKYLLLTIFLFLITSLTLALPLPAQASKAKVTGSVVNIRSGPGTNYDIIGNIYQDTEVETGQTINGWTEVSFKNINGWIRSDLLSPLSEPASFSIRITAGSANLRSGPGTSHAIVGQALKGEVFPVLEELDGWYRIRTKTGNIAYVASFLAKKITASSSPAGNASVPAPAGKPGEIEVYLDGKLLSFDVPPMIDSGRTLVPLRAIFEAMGARVEWRSDTRTVISTRGETTVVMTIGSTSPTVNGKTVPIDVPAKIVNGRTLAPLRFVGEAFGGQVEWEGSTRTVRITSPPPASNPAAFPPYVKTSSLTNLRTGAGTSFSVAEQAAAGETLPVLAAKEGWYQVSRGGKTLWVASWVVEPVWEKTESVPEKPVSEPGNSNSSLEKEASPENTDAIKQPEQENKPQEEPEIAKVNEVRLSRLRDDKGITVRIEAGKAVEPEIIQSGRTLTYTFPGMELKGLNYIKEPVGSELFEVKGVNEEGKAVIRAEIPYGIEYQTYTENNGRTRVITIPNFIMAVEKKDFGTTGERVLITTLTEAEYTRVISGDRIEIKLKHVTLGRASREYRFGGKVIDRVTFTQENDGVTAVIQTRGIGGSSTGKSGDGNILSVMIVGKDAVPVRNQNLIVIDPGHGGKETGAISPSGYMEKIPNLEIALEAGRILKAKGYQVEFTRTDDTFVSLEERAAMANQLNAAVFVSIHNNSSTNREAKGIETYFYAPADRPHLFIQKDEREDLATYVQRELVRRLNRPDRGVKQANFSVLRNTNMPSILCEVAFLSNPEEEMLLKSDYFKRQAAEAIAEGIDRYMKSRR